MHSSVIQKYYYNIKSEFTYLKEYIEVKCNAKDNNKKGVAKVIAEVKDEID